MHREFYGLNLRKILNDYIGENSMEDRCINLHRNFEKKTTFAKEFFEKYGQKNNDFDWKHSRRLIYKMIVFFLFVLVIT